MDAGQRFRDKVGMALARWQMVEIRVQELFEHTLDCKDYRWAAAIYHSVFTFSPKINMTHELLLWRLPTKELCKEWSLLKHRVEDAGRRRNRLVHWAFVGNPPKEGQGVEYYFTVTPFKDSRKTRADEKPLKESDLEQMAKDFMCLGAELDIFRQKVTSQFLPPASP